MFGIFWSEEETVLLALLLAELDGAWLLFRLLKTKFVVFCCKSVVLVMAAMFVCVLL